MDALTYEQLILLENLTYMPWDKNAGMEDITDFEGKTVGELIDRIDFDNVPASHEEYAHMTKDEWQQIIGAIEQDPVLMNMEIRNVHQETVGTRSREGTAVLFRNPETQENVIAFRGSTKTEWADNFAIGGNQQTADGISSPAQERAKEWYESLFGENGNGLLSSDDYITVIGHSKGGNKAKYVTILDAAEGAPRAIDRCISMDGQGFSDEFMETYAYEVGVAHDKIVNLNAESDFANALLNQVGRDYYFKAANIGSGGFVENHCPNAYLHFDENGSYSMIPGERDPMMKEFDLFLNSYLRSMSETNRNEALALVGEIVQGARTGELGKSEIISLLTSNENVDHVAYLLAYAREYQKRYPDVFFSIADVLLGDITDENKKGLIFTKALLLDSPLLDEFLKYEGARGAVFGRSMLNIKEIFRDCGIDLTDEQCRRLYILLIRTGEKMDEIEINEFRNDKTPYFVDDYQKNESNKSTASTNGGSDRAFSVTPDKLQTVASMIGQQSTQLITYGSRAESVAHSLRGELASVKSAVLAICEQITQQAQCCKSMDSALQQIGSSYLSSENTILGRRA